jgi:hypothetical protein
MNWKNTVKKIAAIAGSATMLGATMFGAIAAADLSTLTDKTGVSEFYTTNGELNAFVGVGSCAAVSDVAGAIDLAAAFAQKATLGGEAGGALVAKNVTPGYIYTTGAGGSKGVNLREQANNPTAPWTSSSTGFDWLYNDTVIYNDTVYIFDTSVRMQTAQNTLTSAGNFYWFTEGALIYNISANQTLPLNFDQFPLGGDVYEIVAFDSTLGTLELGQLQPVEGVNIGETVPIGTVGVTAKLNDVRQTQTAWDAVFTVYDTNGNVAETNIQKEAGETYANDTLGITMKVDNLYRDANDVWNVDFQWTESSVKLTDIDINGTATTTVYPGYKVDIGFNGATGINYVAFRTPGGVTPASYFPGSAFGPGDSQDIMGGYFQLKYDELRIGDGSHTDAGTSTEVLVRDAVDYISGTTSVAHTYELVFENNNTKQTSVDLSNYVNVGYQASGYSNPYTVTYSSDDTTATKTFQFKYYNDAGTDKLSVYELSGSTLVNTENITTTSYWINSSSSGTWNFTVDVSGGATGMFNLTLNSFLANGTFFWNNLTYTLVGDTGTVKFVEPDGRYLRYQYNTTTGGTLSNTGLAFVKADDVKYENNDFNEGNTGAYTYYGTFAQWANDYLTFEYPQYKRVAYITVGRTQETVDTVAVGGEIGDSGWVLRSGGGESPVWAFTGPTDQGISKLDTEYTNNAPIVLVGGPNANSLVASLVTGGKAFVGANDTALIPAANHAYVELVEDAFGTYDALIVAGYGAADTRMACKVVASQILHGTPLGTGFEGTRVYLKTSGTGVSTIGDVTVETA